MRVCDHCQKPVKWETALAYGFHAAPKGEVKSSVLYADLCPACRERVVQWITQLMKGPHAPENQCP